MSDLENRLRVAKSEDLRWECDTEFLDFQTTAERGTGRSRMVQHLIKTLAPKTDGLKDYCYVYNFERADRPRLIRLPAGTAPKFRELMLALGEYVNDGLGKALDSEPWLSQRQAIQERVQQSIRDMTRPLEDKLQKSQMALVNRIKVVYLRA